MAWPEVAGVVFVLLPGAIPPGAYALARERLHTELSPAAFRAVRAAWLASATALLVGASLGAYTYAVTTGRLSPTWPGAAFWLEHFVSVYRIAEWALLGGLGLFFLGVVVLLVAGLRRRTTG